MADKKLQVALYWGAACGGCDVAVLDTDEFILAVAAAADIRLWPIAVDGKYADIEAMEDGELDLAIFNGAVRNSRTSTSPSCCAARASSWWPSAPAPTWAGSRGSPTGQRDEIFHGLPP